MRKHAGVKLVSIYVCRVVVGRLFQSRAFIVQPFTPSHSLRGLTWGL
ncbi:MAG: hypothetical protein ACFN4H_04080 [Prevotella sp.]